jgi:hypothetical protein
MRTDLTKLVIGLTGNTERFAAQFNAKLPGAYRQITVQDVRDMTDCGLIRRYGYYIHSDLETVRAVLQYEELIETRMRKSPEEDKLQILCCKLCGDPLPTKHEGKKGRPREYCPKCESLRRRNRYRKWRIRRKALLTL